MSTNTFRDVLADLTDDAPSNVDKGRTFEQVVRAFLQNDKAQSTRFDRVWSWIDWPGRQGRPDTGIDIVARERESRDLIAIQCKCYDHTKRIYLNDISTFLAACGTTDFAEGVIVSASEEWGPNVDNALKNRDKPVARWGPDVLDKSSIDWEKFDLANPGNLTRRDTKTLRPYQVSAVRDTLAGLKERDRGKLIMACGSGKTFTALRVAEEMVGTGGTVLFLTPSISLLSQSLIDWANDADLPLKPFAVCSDTHAGKRNSEEDISPYDLTETPSTDSDHLVKRFNQTDRQNVMTVVFSTYQSLDVVAASQNQEGGLPEFGLIISDEAHRTTGVSLTGKDESNFRRVHDNQFIKGKKRLYMTATPRIYGDRAKKQASESNLTVALTSMDNKEIYGTELHRLSFGEAVEKEILTPYKVVILNVDQQKVGVDLDKLLSDDKTAVNMDNGARMIGCWNGLGKRAAGIDFEQDPQHALRAVAFSNRIRDSELFTEWFHSVIDTVISGQDNPENDLRCEVRHVDGRQNAFDRAKHLAWLRSEPEPNTCRILSNARCLTEGIDVPALDAVIFLDPRKSDIDVVQAVGRVMRKQPGKKFGYIILPIAQVPGATAGESIKSSAYKAVWQVINAISAHDDRFEAIINQFALTSNSSPSESKYTETGIIGTGTGPTDDPTPEEKAIQGILQISAAPEWRDAILAKIVDKFADPQYWEKWAQTIREIAQRHEARIRALLAGTDETVRATFDGFLSGIRNNLHEDITEDEAIGMLSQHLITRPVFDALFADYAFTQNNPVSQAMQGTIDALTNRGLEKETADLENFYRDVRIRAQGVTDAAGKQSIIAELYERFLKLALPETASRLGIVYTPTPVVDYIVRSVEDVLQREFGVSVSDEGVHVIDPFTGTGSFITRLIQNGLIKDTDLQRKYESELHANDIMLLAYYIAAINIEATYHDRANAEEYHPFPGIVLTDTFQSAEEGDPMDEVLFPRNNARIERQKALDIRVILGNPPWSATHNRKYQTIDDQIKRRYSASSGASLVSSLYDPYVRAIRYSSDKVQSSDKGGIVAFVTNGGFIDSNAFDGFRKALADEFHAVYCFDLRGDQRTSGEKSRQEGGKIFGAGSRARVAIILLVKKPGQSDGATIYYRDVGDYLSREEKLNTLDGSSLARTEWQVIEPNQYGDWINQRSEGYTKLRKVAPDTDQDKTGENASVFLSKTMGLVTSRDAWCFTSSEQQLKENIRENVDFYNIQVERFRATNPTGNSSERNNAAKAFAVRHDDPTLFHWDAKNFRDLANGTIYSVDDLGFTTGAYRPFFKQHLYFNRELNNRIRDFPSIYPSEDAINIGISITGLGSNSPFHTLMTDCLAEYCLTAVNSVYLPRWRYTPAHALTRSPLQIKPELEQVSNINPIALTQFRERYKDPMITDDDLFYYTYGVLHSQQWRAAFADDLTKTAARIPMAGSSEEFRSFANSGRQLADLHVNYETVEPYHLEETHADGWDADAGRAYRVEKMGYAGRRTNLDTSRIIYNASITLAGIPSEAHEYRLGSRSALDWLLDRYQVRSDSKSGITNDPNDWAAEHDDPRYILDLVKQVTTVSVKTMEIVKTLPELPI